jgi:hypothetical protein
MVVMQLLRRHSHGSATAQWPPRRVLGSAVTISAAASFAVVGLGLWWGAHDPPRLHVTATFSGSACCWWQTWVNGAAASEITTFSIRKGTADYVAPLYDRRVLRLRMPIGQSVGGEVTIRRIYITRGRRITDTVDVGKLGLTPYGAERTGRSGAPTFRATRSAPLLDTAVALDTHDSRLRLLATKLAADPVRAIVGLLFVTALLAIAVDATTRRGRVTAAAVVAMVVIVRLLPSLTWHLNPRDSVASAVSHSSYVGDWKSRERLLVYLAVAAAAVSAVASVALYRRSARRTVDAAAPQAPLRAGSGRRRTIAVTTASVLLVAGTLPNLRDLIGGTPRYQPAWDANNIIFWRYLHVHVGLRPIRDFFWPYGFQWLFYGHIPWGAQPPAASNSPIGLTTYGAYGLFWVVLLIGSYWFLSLYGPQKLLGPYVALAALVELSVLSGYFWFDMRYIAPVAAVMVYAGLRQSEPAFSGRRMLFAGTLAAVALLEIAQLVYALVPICVIAFNRLLITRDRTKNARQTILIEIGTVAGPVTAAALTYAATGTLRPTATYYRQLSAIASADAFPSQIDQWISHPVSIDALLFWCIPLAIVVGVAGAITSRDGLRGAYVAIAALGTLSLMIMQKQVLRPSIAPQIWLPAIFPLVVLLAIEGLKRERRFRIPGAVAVGSIAASFLVAGGAASSARSIMRAPAAAASDVRASLEDGAAFRRTDSLAFSSEAFDNFQSYRPVAAALRRIPKQRRRLWILGDDSPLIMMTGGSWSYYFTDLYDTAPIAFQKEVIDRLERYPPTRTVWNFAPSAMVFDAVPQVVRAPLLFTWAVQHLVPATTINMFAILRRRAVNEPIALGWWRRRIGESVDLGHVPIVATLPERSCSRVGSCGSYAVVTVPAADPVPIAFDVPVRIGNLAFDVKFAAAPGVRRYVVPLHRLWFWAAAPAAAQRVVIKNAQPGTDVVVQRREDDPNRLY